MINKYSLKISSLIIITLFLLGMQSLAFAGFGFSDLKKSVSGDESSVDTSGVVKNSKKMVEHFDLAMIAINKAQYDALIGLDQGKLAEEAKQAAKAFDKGISDEKAKNKIVKDTEARDKAISKYVKASKKITGKARKHIAKSAFKYAVASYSGARTLKDVVKWGETAKDTMQLLSKDPIGLASFKKDIEPALFVLQTLPDLSSQWVNTSDSLIKYAKINGDVIDVDENILAAEL